jgi:tetratricopeptide (TPR) repeat protein
MWRGLSVCRVPTPRDAWCWTALLLFPPFLLSQTHHFDQGRALYNQQHYREALQELRASQAAHEPVDALPLYTAMCEEQLEHWSEASAELSPYLAGHPSDSQAWYWLGNAQLMQRQFTAARHSFQRAIALNQLYEDGFRGLGLAQFELKDYDGAYHSWLKAAGLNEKDEKVKYYLGRLFYEADFANQAAAWLRQALALNPKDYEAMTYLALSAEVLNFQDTAQQLYRAAIDTSTSQGKPYAWAYLSLANLLRKRGNDDEALAILEEGAKKCPEAHELTKLGELLASHNRKPEAEQVLRRAVALDPSLSEAHYRLALLLKSSGDDAGSNAQMEAFRKAKAQESSRPKIMAIRR